MGQFAFVMCFALLLILIAYGQIVFTEDTNVNNSSLTPKVNFTVVYEARGHRSRKFFNKILVPFLCSIQDYVVLDFKPVAKEMVYIEGNWIFKCAHGEIGCKYSKYHACGLNLIDNNDKKFKFVSCLMKDETESMLEKCSEQIGVSSDKITRCANSELGDSYLSNSTDDAITLGVAVKHTPTVLLNGVLFHRNQEHLRYHHHYHQNDGDSDHFHYHYHGHQHDNKHSHNHVYQRNHYRRKDLLNAVCDILNFVPPVCSEI